MTKDSSFIDVTGFSIKSPAFFLIKAYLRWRFNTKDALRRKN